VKLLSTTREVSVGRSAKVLVAADVRRVLAAVSRTRQATRNKVMVLLSFKAGLRAGEIAGLDWRMVLQPNGRVGNHVDVRDSIAKYGSGRRVPLHPELKAALVNLHAEEGCPKSGALARSQQGGHMRARAVVNWFRHLYKELELEGCSSHSGRRTFITRSARLITRTGGSLKDVQELAGHRAITTTERYIEGDREAQRRIVSLV
jgi:integrase/recombinase XerD